MYHFRTIFLLALGASLVLWVATWWRTAPLHTTRYKGSLSSIAFGADGHLFVVESNGGIRDRISDPQAYSVALSPDGRRLATGGRGVVRVWDASSGQLLQTLPHHSDTKVRKPIVDIIAFSPDGQLLATSDDDRQTVRLWRMSDGQLRYAIPYASASLAFSPDGQDLILGSSPIRIFRLADGREVRQIDADGQVALSPDGRLLAVIQQYNNDGLRIFRYQDGALLTTFRGAHAYSYAAVFSPDSAYLATTYIPAGSSGWTIPLDSGLNVPTHLWRTSDWGQVQTFSGHPHGGYLLAFSPDGHQLASAGSDKMVRLWPVAPHAAWWYWLGPLSVLVVLAAALAWRVWAR